MYISEKYVMKFHNNLSASSTISGLNCDHLQLIPSLIQKASVIVCAKSYLLKLIIVVE